MMSVLLLSAMLSADPTIVATDGPAGPYCAFPGACKLPDGRILCVYYNGTGHVTTTSDRPGGGGIAYVLSDDDGATWSKPAMLLDTDMDDRDPNVSVLRDGRVVLNWFRHVGDGVYMAELAIDGATITAGTPRKLLHDAGIGGPVRDMGDGLLFCGAYHIDQPYILRSPDNGRTWQVAAPYNSGQHLDAEPDIVRAGDGYLAVFRGRGCNGHWSTSPDGIRWSDAADIGFPLHCPELLRVTLGRASSETHGGEVSCGHNSESEPRLAEPKTCPASSVILLAHRVPATALHWSTDEGRTWQGPVQVDTCGGAYPAMVDLGGGRVLIVYYTEGAESDIRCRVFTVTNGGVHIQ